MMSKIIAGILLLLASTAFALDEEHINRTETRFDRLEAKIDAINARIDTLQTLLVGTILGLVALIFWDRRSAVSPLEKNFQSLEARVRKIEEEKRILP